MFACPHRFISRCLETPLETEGRRRPGLASLSKLQPEGLELALPSTFQTLSTMVVANGVVTARRDWDQKDISIHNLPDELLLHILWFLDIPDLYATSRVGSNPEPRACCTFEVCLHFQASRHLRALSLDPLLHQLRLKYAHDRVKWLLARRPPLSKLQPPSAAIYLTRTHIAARRLHWSLVCIRLQRSLSRRPPLKSLISTGKIPRECCRYDRRSGEIVWGTGVAGALVERKRKVEREQIKEGLRVWLERKAREIRSRKNEGGVGTLVWRFSRKFRMGESKGENRDWSEKPKRDKVTGLKRFFEDLGS